VKKSLLIVLILLVAFAVNTSIGYCQQPNPSNASPNSSGPDAHALKIRHQLEYLGYGRDVTVRLRHGRDYHGRIVDTGVDSFRLDEVDLRQVVSVSYSDIKRIDAGYRGQSLIGNTRPNPHTSKIIAFATLGGLAIFLGVLVHSMGGH
jgi:hypothetical protein